MRQTFREGLSHLKHYREGLSHLKHDSQMRPIRHPNYPQMRQMRIPLSKIISRIIIDIIITQHKSNDYSPSYGAKSCFICANCSQIRPMGSHLCKSLIDETDETSYLLTDETDDNYYNPSYGAKSFLICANRSQIRPMGSHLCKAPTDETSSTS